MPTDPGLQAERTALAWQRTGVAGCAVAGATGIAAARLAPPWVLAAVMVLAASCAVAVAVAVRSAVGAGRIGRASRPGAGTPWVRLVAVAAVPVLLGTAGVLLALTAA